MRAFFVLHHSSIKETNAPSPFPMLFIGLMMVCIVFFVYLLSISYIDQRKLNQLTRSLSTTFAHHQIYQLHSDDAQAYDSLLEQNIKSLNDLKLKLHHIDGINILSHYQGDDLLLQVENAIFYNQYHKLYHNASLFLHDLITLYKKLNNNQNVEIEVLFKSQENSAYKHKISSLASIFETHKIPIYFTIQDSIKTQEDVFYIMLYNVKK